MTSILPGPSDVTSLPQTKRAPQRRSLQELLCDVTDLPSRLPDVVARKG